MDLTIDPNVQAEAQILLTNLVNKYRSTGGTILVQEPKSGKILALVDAPTFDPNDYGKASLESFGNGAIAKQYEPGSVVKVLTMAAGLDAGKFTPDTTVYDDGDFEVSGFHIHNWDLKAYGTVSMTNIIEHSLNVGTSLAQRIEGKEVFLKYINAFGYGQKTGIDLPGEISGNLGEITQKGASEIAWSTASFGQGIAATPIQVISAVSALANGGTLMRPYVNAALEPKEVRRVIKPETSKAVAKMMTTAVITNKIAAIRGYDVAGKTGTAQLAVGGKYGNNVINTYVGFAPSYDPRFSILVKLDQPAGAPLAGQTIVPVFRDLAQFLLTYYEVPPDHPSER
jgi:cell division protein FtsI/penicillin-binding protein 2